MPEITQLNKLVTEIKANTQTPSQIFQKQQALKPAEAPVIEEEKKDEDVVEVKKEEVDPRFIALSKQAKAQREKELRLQAYEKELQEKYGPGRELLELKEKDKFAAAEKLGLTYEEWTNHQLGEMNLSPEQIAERKAIEIVEKRFTEERELRQREEDQRFQQNYQAALKQVAEEAKELAGSSQDFPIVKNIEAFDTVASIIEQNFFNTGKTMPVEAATKLVEESFRSDILEFYKLLAPQEKKEEQMQPQPGKPQVQSKPNQTLTHKQTVSPAPTATPKNESWEAKKQRLLHQFGV